jgi:hypothetical protein
MPSTTYTGEETFYSTTMVDRGPRVTKTGPDHGAPTYLMKATDTGLSRVVYWKSIGIDSAGAQYTGTGPLTDITYVVKGTP